MLISFASDYMKEFKFNLVYGGIRPRLGCLARATATTYSVNISRSILEMHAPLLKVTLLAWITFVLLLKLA